MGWLSQTKEIARGFDETWLLIGVAVTVSGILLLFHTSQKVWNEGPEPSKAACESAIKAQVVAENNGSGYTKIPAACVDNSNVPSMQSASENDSVGYFPNSTDRFRLKNESVN